MPPESLARLSAVSTSKRVIGNSIFLFALSGFCAYEKTPERAFRLIKQLSYRSRAKFRRAIGSKNINGSNGSSKHILLSDNGKNIGRSYSFQIYSAFGRALIGCLRYGWNCTAQPEEVAEKMKELLFKYNANKEKTFDDILDFHYRFEKNIKPKTYCLKSQPSTLPRKSFAKYNIVPFIIDEELKLFYYRGLKEWQNERGYLRDTCLTAQDKFKLYLDYFKVQY